MKNKNVKQNFYGNIRRHKTKMKFSFSLLNSIQLKINLTLIIGKHLEIFTCICAIAVYIYGCIRLFS